jgi:hypothetical protein
MSVRFLFIEAFVTHNWSISKLSRYGAGGVEQTEPLLRLTNLASTLQTEI